jgi:putative ABC transport system permease protein
MAGRAPGIGFVFQSFNLGVTFISGTLVLSDTLNSMFSVLIGNVYSNLDFEVRGDAQFSGGSAVRNPLPESLLASVRRVPGVADAQGVVSGYAQYIARDGKPVSTGGEPTLGVNYDPDARISTLHIVQGGPPRTADDVVMDAGTDRRGLARPAGRQAGRPGRHRVPVTLLTLRGRWVWASARGRHPDTP